MPVWFTSWNQRRTQRCPHSVDLYVCMICVFRYDGQVIRKDPTRYDRKQNKRAWAAPRRTVWIQTQTQHVTTSHHGERVTRNFGKRRLTGTVFLDVANAFGTVWVNGLVYKLTILNFPSYLVRIILPTWSDIWGVMPGSHILSPWHRVD